MTAQDLAFGRNRDEVPIHVLNVMLVGLRLWHTELLAEMRMELSVCKSEIASFNRQISAYIQPWRLPCN